MDISSHLSQIEATYSLLSELTLASSLDESAAQKFSIHELNKRFDDAAERAEYEPIRNGVVRGLQYFHSESEKQNDTFWNIAIRISACFAQLVDLYEHLRKQNAQQQPDGEHDEAKIGSELISVRDSRTLRRACETLLVFGIAANLEVPVSSLHLSKRVAHFDTLLPDFLAYRGSVSQSVKRLRCLFVLKSVRLEMLVESGSPNVAHTALLDSGRMDCVALLFQLARYDALRRKKLDFTSESESLRVDELASRFVDRFAPVRDLILLQSNISMASSRNEESHVQVVSEIGGWLRAVCAFHLGRLIMRPDGLKSVVFTMLTECLGVDSAEVWRTDARKFETVATLIGRAPPHIDPAEYYHNLSQQFCCDSDYAALTPVYAHLIGALLSNDSNVAYKHFLNALLAPLQRILKAVRAEDEAEIIGELELLKEAEMNFSISRLHAVFVAHADPRSLDATVDCLRGVLHVLFAAYVRVRQGVSSLKSLLRDLIVVTLRHADSPADLLIEMLVGIPIEAETQGVQVRCALRHSLLFNESIAFENGDSGGLRVLHRSNGANQNDNDLDSLLNLVSAARLEVAASTKHSDADAESDSDVDDGQRLEPHDALLRDALVELIRSVGQMEKQFATSLFFSLLRRWTVLASPVRRARCHGNAASSTDCLGVENDDDEKMRRLLSVVTATLEQLVGEFEPAAFAQLERKAALLTFAADFLNSHVQSFSAVTQQLEAECDAHQEQDALETREQVANHLRTAQLALAVAMALLPGREEGLNAQDEQRFWSQMASALLPSVDRLAALLVTDTLLSLGQASCDASRLCSAIRAAVLTHAAVMQRPSLEQVEQSEECDAAFLAIQRCGVRLRSFDFKDSKAVCRAVEILLEALTAATDVVSLGALQNEFNRLLRLSASVRNDVRVMLTERRVALLNAVTCALAHDDTFVYLAAVELLVSVISIDDCRESRSAGANAFRLLVTEFRRLVNNLDAARLSLALTLSEALQRSMHSLGQLVTCYRQELLGAFLTGARNSDELVRASCLAALADLCPLLGHDLFPDAVELCAAAEALARSDRYAEVRRAAVLLLTALVQFSSLSPTDCSSIIRDTYRVLRDVSSADCDETVRGHALVALGDVDKLAKRLILGTSDNDPRKLTKRIFVLDPPSSR